MSEPKAVAAKKPRKPAAKKPAAKKVAEKKVAAPKAAPAAKADRGESKYSPSLTASDPVARAVALGLKACGGNKGRFAELIGMQKPNLSRVMREARLQELGQLDRVAWPLQHVLKLAQISGVKPGLIAPAHYEEKWTATRYKPDAA